jgi:MFS family permease
MDESEHRRPGGTASRLWLSRLFEDVRARVDRPIAISLGFFGGLPGLIIAVYVAARWSYMSPTYLFSLGALLLVTGVAPYLIWYYDTRLFPEFLGDVEILLAGESTPKEIGERYQRLIADRWWLPAIAASLPIPVLTLFGQPFLRQRGLLGATDPLFWPVFAVLLWIGVIVGIGFLLVAVTFLVIRDISAEPLRIDPMHPDGLGGMTIIGRFAIRTTALFSLGALLLPLQMQYASTVGPTATTLIYVMAGIYGFFIAGSFLYPTLKINRRANAVRETILHDLREQYQTLKREADEPRVGAAIETTDPAVEQKLDRIRTEYEDYDNVRLYPMEISIITRLVGSVVLPFASVGMEYLLQPGVIGTLLDGWF